MRTLRLLILATPLALGCRGKLVQTNTDTAENSDADADADSDSDADADGGPIDTGEPNDTADPVDTGVPVDTGTSSDTGDAEDTGNSGDTGDTGDTEPPEPVDVDGDGFSRDDGDCDDSDGSIYPGAEETCDGIDNDCDGYIDDADPDGSTGTTTWFGDADGDGYGGDTFIIEACVAPDHYVSLDGDCDDLDDNTYPDAPEDCADADRNCDGDATAGAVDTSTFAIDSDGDGYGDPSDTISACAPTDSYVADTSDCDDSDASTYPGAPEDCADADRNCDGDATAGAVDVLTGYLDDDGDGFGDPDTTTTACSIEAPYVTDSTDCNDLDDSTYPGAPEDCADADRNCDGDATAGATDTSIFYLDDDGDGFGASSITMEACIADEDYVTESGDCDDGSSSIFPGATETCNDIDDDCDLLIDEELLGTEEACAADDCAEILAANPSAEDGTYTLTRGSHYCDMTTDGGGWTLVGNNARVYGTGHTGSSYNSAGFYWTQALFAYDSGSVVAGPTYPGSLPGSNPVGHRFGSESWSKPLAYGGSTCSLSTVSYADATEYISDHDWVITRGLSNNPIQVGTLEGVAGCTTADNPGEAFIDIYVR